MNVYGVIMAGGGGTRFWPLSRKNKPKQLLSLSGKDVMINETIARLSLFIKKENEFIVTGKNQVEEMIKVTEGKVYKENILTEPSARNTSACIGYSAIKILKEKGDGVMVVTPSDAYIKDEEEYARILMSAVEVAKKEDCIVTIGITPTIPATGYGYIQYHENGEIAKKVERFVEKPNEEKAKEYLSQGNFVWNSGVFVFKASFILTCFERFLPEIYRDLTKIGASIGTPEEKKVLEEIYPQIYSVSVDYGIMEKEKNIKVIPGNFGWSDVGSWDMMDALHKPDDNGNISIGDNILCDTVNSTVYSENKLIAVVGMDGVVVVEAGGAILVCPKDKAQDVKKAVEQLKEKAREDLL